MNYAASIVCWVSGFCTGLVVMDTWIKYQKRKRYQAHMTSFRKQVDTLIGEAMKAHGDLTAPKVIYKEGPKA